MGWLYAKLGSLHFVLYLPKNGDMGLELVWAKLILTAVKWVGGYLWIREWLEAWIQLGLSLSSESSFLYLLSVSLTCVCARGRVSISPSFKSSGSLLSLTLSLSLWLNASPIIIIWYTKHIKFPACTAKEEDRQKLLGKHTSIDDERNPEK